MFRPVWSRTCVAEFAETKKLLRRVCFSFKKTIMANLSSPCIHYPAPLYALLFLLTTYFATASDQSPACPIVEYVLRWSSCRSHHIFTACTQRNSLTTVRLLPINGDAPSPGCIQHIPLPTPLLAHHRQPMYGSNPHGSSGGGCGGGGNSGSASLMPYGHHLYQQQGSTMMRSNSSSATASADTAERLPLQTGCEVWGSPPASGGAEGPQQQLQQQQLQQQQLEQVPYVGQEPLYENSGGCSMKGSSSRGSASSLSSACTGTTSSGDNSSGMGTSSSTIGVGSSPSPLIKSLGVGVSSNGSSADFGGGGGVEGAGGAVGSDVDSRGEFRYFECNGTYHKK